MTTSTDAAGATLVVSNPRVLYWLAHRGFTVDTIQPDADGNSARVACAHGEGTVPWSIEWRAWLGARWRAWGRLLGYADHDDALCDGHTPAMFDAWLARTHLERMDDPMPASRRFELYAYNDREICVEQKTYEGNARGARTAAVRLLRECQAVRGERVEVCPYSTDGKVRPMVDQAVLADLENPGAP